jgi:tetratricopeptide (TPR) repeat protein
LQSAIGEDWYNLTAHTELGALYDQIGRSSDALREFKSVIATDPYNALAIQGAALAQINLGDVLEAERILHEGMGRIDKPRVYSLKMTLARVLIERGSASQRGDLFGEALNETVEAMALRPNEADPYFYAGLARYKQGELSNSLRERLAYRRRALKFFDACLKKDPTNLEAQRNRDLISSQQKESQGVILGGTFTAVMSVAILFGLWLGFFLSPRVTATMVITLTPILAGLVIVAFLLPTLTHLKLPGLEANLKQDISESVASGPSGEEALGSARVSVAQGPQ